jgi:MFS family permease
MIHPDRSNASRAALAFVLLVGALSFFADFVYEGSRSIIGPYLATLGATATIIGIVTGLGECLCYGLRLVSGRLADATGYYWTIVIAGYAIQMIAVPAMAFTTSWPAAAALIITERIGKAIRNPTRDLMLSHAAHHLGGYGWAFGLHEALDQSGAMLGPLVIAFVLVHGGRYHEAFAVLVIPAVINLVLLFVARRTFPRPQDLEPARKDGNGRGYPRVYWIYLGGAALVALGFADFPLIAYHLSRTRTVPVHWVPIFYAVAMAVSGAGSLLFGRLFDRYGFRALIALTVLSALFAPLVFLGSFDVALVGVAVWGLGMGVHETIIPAAIAPMVPASRRASAFGLFTSAYGISWFVGSAAIGLLYDSSVWATVVFCISAELLAVPIFVEVTRRTATGSAHP